MRQVRALTRTSLIALLAGMFAIGISACEDEGPVEKAGEAVEETGDTIEEAADDAEGAAEEAGDELEEAADRVEEETDSGGY